jgi:hypothetical protein
VTVYVNMNTGRLEKLDIKPVGPVRDDYARFVRRKNPDTPVKATDPRLLELMTPGERRAARDQGDVVIVLVAVGQEGLVEALETEGGGPGEKPAPPPNELMGEFIGVVLGQLRPV